VSFFSVTPDELVAGSAVVGGATAGTGAAAVADAAAMTPVEGAWAAFVDRAATASIAMDEVAVDLAKALANAAAAYARSDATAAGGLAVHR
jgi:hypothetical protein